MVLLGHCLSGRFTGLNALYFFDGSASIGIFAFSVFQRPIGALNWCMVGGEWESN